MHLNSLQRFRITTNTFNTSKIYTLIISITFYSLYKAEWAAPKSDHVAIKCKCKRELGDDDRQIKRQDRSQRVYRSGFRPTRQRRSSSRSTKQNNLQCVDMEVVTCTVKSSQKNPPEGRWNCFCATLCICFFLCSCCIELESVCALCKDESRFIAQHSLYNF